MPKTISQLFASSHEAAAKRQRKRFGNPLTTPPPQVGPALERAVQARQLTADQARKLATRLGRKSYGEIGLTSAVIGSAIDEIVGFGKLPWYSKAEIENRIAA